MNGPTSYPNPLLAGVRLPDGVSKAQPLYYFLRLMCHVVFTSMWKLRVFNRHYEPAEGSAVYVSNHQSFLDPMLMSLALKRPMSYMARASLFRTPGFRQLIAALNAFPVKQGEADLAAMKEAMRRLKAGGQVVLFAEGTRTYDGRISPFLPGIAMLSQRAAKWTVPVLIDGAYEAWPRSQVLPSPGSVVVQYGKPISQEEARSMSGQAFVDRLRETIIDIQSDVRRRIGRPALDYSGMPTTPVRVW